MAVFTTFPEAALHRYLAMFGKGQLVTFQAIEDGIENSNYFVTLAKDDAEQDYVLTIIEQLGFDEVHFFNRILAQLSQEGLPVAAPERTLDGMTLTLFCGKPAFLFPRLPGSHVREVQASHCVALGKFLGASHTSLAALEGTLKETRTNPYDAAWMHSSLEGLRHRMSAPEADLLARLVREYAQLSAEDLPRGFIHGDLFRDNALFVDETLTGVIDFYHACHDFLLQDLAIAINDWCLDDQYRIDPGLADALILGYESQRPLTRREKTLLKPLQRSSAARFALTRFLSGDPPLKNPQAMLELAGGLLL